MPAPLGIVATTPTVTPPAPADDTPITGADAPVADTTAADGTTATTGDGATPVGDDFETGPATPVTPARPGLLTRVKDQLVSVAWRELARTQRVKLTDLHLGDFGVAAVRAFEQVFNKDNRIVTDDPHRAAYERTHPEDHIWLRTGGVVDAQIGLSTSLPIAGGVNATLGFTSKGALEYSVLAPYDAAFRSAEALARNMTVDLPFTGDRAINMVEGQEITVRGSGNVGASVGVSYGGGEIDVGPVTGGVNAGVTVSGVVSGDISLNIKRLDGNRVYVRLGRNDSADVRTVVGATGRINIDRSEVRDDLRDLGVGSIVDTLTGVALPEVVRQVEKAVRFDASASLDRGVSSQHVGSFVLDLSSDEAKKAYEALLRLDIGPASRLAASGDAVRSLYDERGDFTAGNVRVTVGPLKLLLIDTLRKDSEGTLDSNGDREVIKRASFTRRSEGLLTDDRNVTWEGVDVQRSTGDADTYFHLAFQKKDGDTRQSEVDAFQRFARAVDANFDQAPELKRDPDWFRRVFNGDYGDTQTNVDIYFTQQGLENIAKATDDDIRRAWGAASQRVRGGNVPGFAGPNGDDAVARITAWNQFIRDGGKGARTRAEMQDQYRARFGNNIEQDASLYAQYQPLRRTMGPLDTTPREDWIRPFADLGAAAGFAFYIPMATLTLLAGPENSLVHRASVTGDRANIVSRDEGYRPDPATDVGRALEAP